MASVVRKALLAIAVSPRTLGDAERLANALQRMAAEGAAVESRPGQNPGEVILGAMSEEDLEILFDRFQREFHIKALVGCPGIEYRAALTAPVEGQTEYATHVTGHTDYAHIRLRLTARPAGSGVIFKSQCESLPPDYIRAVERGVLDRLGDGLVHGHPIDVGVDLCSGSRDPVHSNESAFRLAGFLAVEDAILRAELILLEPVMRLGVVVPREYGGDLARDLAGRGGDVESVREDGELAVIQARVRLGELFGFRVDLSARTQGRGKYSMQLESYVPVRPGDDGGDSFVRAPLGQDPRPRINSVSLPEPQEDGQ